MRRAVSKSKKFLYTFFIFLFFGVIYLIYYDIFEFLKKQIVPLKAEPLSLFHERRIEAEIFKEHAIKKFLPLRKGLSKHSNEVLDYVINSMIYQGFLKNNKFEKFELSFPKYIKKYKEQWLIEKEKLKDSINLDGIRAAPEVFYFHHGLRFANSKILNYIKNKDMIDCGCFVGDSLLVLKNYTNKTIYCYDFYKPNIEKFKKIMKLNKICNGYKLIPMAIGAQIGQIETEQNNDINVAAVIKKGKETIKITTIDEEIKKHNINVGFIKVDVEGDGMNVIKGAINTIKTQRPVLSLAVYHNSEELFDMKPFLEQYLNDYVFEFKLQAFQLGNFAEMILFVYPKELVDENETTRENNETYLPMII